MVDRTSGNEMTNSAILAACIMVVGFVLMMGLPEMGCCDPGYKRFVVTDSSIVIIHCALRYSTDIVFPAGEEVVNTPIGDGAAVPPGQNIDALPTWEIWPYANTVAVKPTLRHARTSMSVGTRDRSGVYRTTTFELIEDGQPYMKVVIARQPAANQVDPEKAEITRLKEQVGKQDIEIAEYKIQVASDAQNLQAAETKVSQLVDARKYVAKVHTNYRLGKGASRPPFSIQEVFDDGRWTYIRCACLEPPSFYALLDGKPELVYYRYHNGLYTIQQLLSSGGLLRIGKKQVTFTREQDSGKRASRQR
jgi:type IV secretory pathway VirB9-like protein